MCYRREHNFFLGLKKSLILLSKVVISANIVVIRPEGLNEPWASSLDL